MSLRISATVVSNMESGCNADTLSLFNVEDTITAVTILTVVFYGIIPR